MKEESHILQRKECGDMKTRKLFYIYSYKNGMRQKNVGFLECRGLKSKYNFNLIMKIPQEYLAENIDICLYKLYNGEMEEFKLGTANLLEETCRFSADVETDILKEKGFELEDVSGVYIFSNEYQPYVFRADMSEKSTLKMA